MEAHPQVPPEKVSPSNNSSEHHKVSTGLDQGESDTEAAGEDDDICEATGAGLRHLSRTADKETSNLVTTVRLSTSSGLSERALVRRMAAARVPIMPGGAYPPPVLPSSSVALY